MRDSHKTGDGTTQNQNDTRRRSTEQEPENCHTHKHVTANRTFIPLPSVRPPRRSFFVDARLCGVVFGDAVVRSGNPCDYGSSWTSFCPGRRRTVGTVDFLPAVVMMLLSMSVVSGCCRRRRHCRRHLLVVVYQVAPRRFEVDGKERGVLVLVLVLVVVCSTTTLPQKS